MDDRVRLLAQSLLKTGFEKLTEREQRVISRIAERLHVTRNANRAFAEDETFGQRLSDRVAGFGGSWVFVSGFGLFLFAWAILNSQILGRFDAAFDPYPYVFLNLVLSMLAAVQAPIILMAQNRQAAKDRLTASLDYEVNLKAELEIMALHQKLDLLRQQEIELLAAGQREVIALLHKVESKLLPAA